MQRQTDLLSQTGLWCYLINDKRDRKEGGRAFDGGIEGEKVLHQENHSGFIKTGLLMFKWQGLYLCSDMLPNGGGKKEKHSLSGQHSGEKNSLSKALAGTKPML